MNRNKSPLRALLNAGLWVVTAVYLMMLVKIVLLKYGWNAGLRSYNLVPFQFVADLLRHDVSIDVSLKNILGNFALFIPLGILGPALVPRLDRWWKGVLLGLSVSLACETLQFAFGLGASDVDDLILNTLGAAAGSALYFGLLRRLAPDWKARAASLAFLCAFGLAGVLALWLYAPGELPAVVETVNAESLEGLDLDTYAYSGSVKQIGGDAVVFSRLYSAEGEPVASRLSYPICGETRFYGCTLTYRFSPNGNIQKTTCTYDRLDVSSAQQRLASNENAFADIWLDGDGTCTALVLTVYGN